MHRNNITKMRNAKVGKTAAEVSQNVRQGCPLLPVLSNFYLDKVTYWWRNILKSHFTEKEFALTTLLMTSRNYEHKLQEDVCKLNQTGRKCNLHISLTKKK
jgi:hypothetical protein